MNRQLNLSAKKYNFLQKLEVNYFVDAIDENKWKVAKIIGFKNVGHRHTITLHFDGFPNNWDQDFDLPASNKLAPFRRFTLPYTGPQQNNRAIHRQPANLNFQQPLLDLKKIGKQEKQKLKPEWIIQTYRGELFILIDTLLTQNIKLKIDQYQQIVKLFQAYIETGIAILKYSIEKINEISKQNITDPNVIYVNTMYALFSSLPEILFNFNSMISSKEKRVKFYYQTENPEEERKKLRNVLKTKQIVAICRSLLQYQNPPFRGFPWTTKKQALVLLSGLQQQIQFPKIVDNRQGAQALQVLYYLRNKQAFSEETIQNIHIQIVIGLILGGNFQGKLRGLAELRRFCEGTFSLKKQILKQKILTPQLLNALTDSSTFNGQIFKRSLTIFETASKYDLLNDQILKRILSLHKDKHEQEIKSYYSTLSDFGSILNEKKTLQFFQQIKKFPIDFDTINLIKQYTLNVIKNHPVYKKRYADPQSGLGLTYLWQILKQQHPPQVINQAISAFSVLAGNDYYKQIIQKYLIQCFNNIKSGKNIQTSLKVIHMSLNKNNQLALIVENIDKQFSIIDTVIKSMIEATPIQSKTIENIFEFLEEVNQFARKKITVEHIKDLWNLKECQNSLLKFMRKYNQSVPKQKSNDKIINKKLSSLEIREIISKIFLNKALMDSYANVDEQLYKAIDELLVSYNQRTKFIEYNLKHSIRYISVQDLYGLEIYLEICQNCKDQDISNKSLRRFIQYYLRPYGGRSNSTKTDKVGVWLLCADKLTKFFDQSPKKYLSYSFLFQQIKGRMISLNITDPSDSSFTVFSRSSNLKKIITLPRCSSLWKMRQVINNTFKLNKSNFEMYICNQSNNATDMEKQEDYSVAFVDASKDPTAVGVIIIQSKQPHPHFISIQQFKTNFGNYYAQRIYQSLNQIKSLNIQLVCLKLLSQLPCIKNLQSKLTKLQIGKQVTWEQVLDGQCRAKLFYQIGVLNKVKTLGMPWVSNFIKKGGTEHIEKILRSRNSSKTAMVSKDYQFLSQLMQFFMQIIQFYKLHQPNLPFNEASIIQIMKLSNKDKSNPELMADPAFLDYFYLSFITLQEILKYQNIEGQKILASSQIQQLIEVLIFAQSKTKYQNRFSRVLFQVSVKCKCQQLLSMYAQKFLKKCQSNPKLKYSCRLFFDLLILIFDNNFVTNTLYFQVLEFIKFVRFEGPELYKDYENKPNELIHGWLRLCKCLILKSITTNNELKSIPESQQKFADFLISEGLFKQGHKFYSQQCRTEAFQILSLLTCSKYAMEKVGTQISPILMKGLWRKQSHWFVKSFKLREKDTKVGLRNLAATCYINSLLQQLYNIKQFREPLLSIDTKAIDTTQNIAHELQKIFAYLKYSNKQVYSIQSFCETFISEGQPIDPRVQMDIDQFFHTLMDKLQHNLMAIKKQDIIDDVFKGQYSNLIVGQECQHKSERIQHFLSMRLEIINKTSLQQALQQFIKGQVLEGQNAYFCQKCDKKIKAFKRVCVKSLPDVLILALKRFEFDFDRMQKFKLNSYCQFNEFLNMQPYMRESLYENEEKLPSQNYQYKLKGVVIHYGFSQAGHYTSYIRIQNGEWKYFDDDKISNFEFKDLGKQCFGGAEDNQFSDNSQKLKNAYLLIYEKLNRNKINQLVPNQNIKAEVDGQNLNNQQIKVIFDHGLQKFFDTNALALGKSYILFTHLVSLRSEQRPQFFKKSYENCISIFQSNVAFIQWYLQNFSQAMIKQFLIYGNFEAELFVSSLLIYSVSKVFNPDFIKRCMKCVQRKNMVPLNKVFQAANYNPNYLKVLNEYSFHEKILKIVKQDKAPTQGSLTKIAPIRTQFGEPNLDFYEKKDYRNSIQLIQSIELFKFKISSLEDLESFSKRCKKLACQASLAKLYAPKFKDQQGIQLLVNKLIIPYLTKFQPKPEEEYYFRFMMVMMAKLCEVKDQFTKRRCTIVAEIYCYTIRESLDGYRAMRLLLEGFFSLCFNNQMVRDEVVAYLSDKDNKKYVKMIRQWMKESDRFYMNVKNDKLGYWRKISKVTYAQMELIQNDIKVTPERYLSLFNSLLQKHKYQFSDLFSPSISVGQRVSLNQIDEFEYEVVDKIGVALRIKNKQGQERIVLEDDVIPQRSI